MHSLSPQSKGEETHPDHTRPFKNPSCATNRKASIKKEIQSRTQESAETNVDKLEETVFALPQEMRLSIGWYFFPTSLCEKH